MYWDQMKGLDPLKDDIHLPGWDSSYTQDEVRDLIRAYGELGEEGLWQNLEYFLKTRDSRRGGVRRGDGACTPMIRRIPIFGLPRVITREENIDRYLAIVDSPANTHVPVHRLRSAARPSQRHVRSWCASTPR